MDIELANNKEFRKLKRIFSKIDPNKQKVVRSLMERAAFITVSLEKLEDDLEKHGWVEEYQNGEFQKGMKKSAFADVHIALTKNLIAITKQLLELVPEEEKKVGFDID